MNEKTPEKVRLSRGRHSSGKNPGIRLSALRSRPALTYLVIFLVLMTASVLMYTAVISGSQTGALILLLLAILANILSLIF
ncbi:MAG: hypothetical protein ACK2TT_06375 [Anaerolineales bacterium]